MSVNFSTITPMSQSTISRAPAYTTATQQPAANTLVGPAGHYAPKKKSHWFLKTLVAAAIVLGGSAALRGKVNMFKNFNVADKLAADAKFLDKAKFYGKKAVAVVGDWTTNNWNRAVKYIKDKFSKPAAPTTPAP